MFRSLSEWFERRRALRELRAIERQDNQAYSGFFTDRIDAARLAMDGGSPDKALAIWREMHTTYPDLSLTSEKAINLLIDLGHYDEAEAHIKEGRGRYSRHKTLYASALIRVAHQRGDPEETLRRCDVARRELPELPDGYGEAAACLVELGRLEEAETLLQRGVEKLPKNFDLNMRYAQAATRRLDWPEGLKRWEAVQRDFEHLPGPLGVAECLRELGRIDEAKQILVDACERFRMNPWGFVELANLATKTGDFDEAARLWESVLNRFPWFDLAYPQAAEALRRVGRDADADEFLRVGMTRSPGNLAVNLEYAQSAHRRGDWKVARQRWALVRERFPSCVEAREREAEAAAAQEGQATDR